MILRGEFYPTTLAPAVTSTGEQSQDCDETALSQEHAPRRIMLRISN